MELRDGERILARADRLTEPRDPWLAQSLEVLEAITALEEINDVMFAIPEEISHQDGTTLLHVGMMLHEGGLDVIPACGRPEGLKQVLDGGPIQVHEHLFVKVLGREAYVGSASSRSPTTRSSQTAPDKDGNVEVLFVPTSGLSAGIRMNVIPGNAKSTDGKPGTGGEDESPDLAGRP